MEKLMSIMKANWAINKILLFVFLFLSIASVNAKTEKDGGLLDKLEQLSVEKNALKRSCDSLKKVQKVKLDSVSAIVKSLETRIKADSMEMIKKLESSRDSVALLKADLEKNKKYENELSVLKISVSDKEQTIASLNNTIKQKDETIAQEKKNSDMKASQSYEKGKSDAKSLLENIYKSNSIDQIIELSTKGSIERDLKVIDKFSSVYSKLQQALIFFQSAELLNRKYNQSQVSDAKMKLKSIQGSKKAASLWTLLDDYSSMSDGLYSSIDKINEIDAKERVSGMGDNVKSKKYAKIFGVLSEYVFGYGLKAEEYPYVYNVWIQILNKKQADPDASVKDLQLLLK